MNYCHSCGARNLSIYSTLAAELVHDKEMCPQKLSHLFLSRDAVRKRGLCSGPVSVRLSVTFVHSIQMAEDIVKLLYLPGSTIILVFDPRRRCPIPMGTPSTGAQNTRGWKILRFSTEIAVHLENGTR